MAKATFALKNATLITIEGTTAEIQELLDYYENRNDHKLVDDSPQVIEKKDIIDLDKTKKKEKPDPDDIQKIVNLIKTCEDAEKIENTILDNPNEANRVLLPLYIIFEFFNNSYGLSTSEISFITVELGIKISRQNVLRALKFSASSYVMKMGNPPRYTLNRRGVAHIRSVFLTEQNPDQKVAIIPPKLTPKKRRQSKKIIK